jgi:protein SCO1/2
MWNHAAAAALALSVGAGTLALKQWYRPADDPSRKPVTGIVLTAPEGRSVRIAHDEIPGYMDAMTMAFTLADGESAALKPGDRVRFVLRVGKPGNQAEDVRVTGHGPLPATDESAARTVPVSRLKPGDTLPAFALVDERGRAFTDADMRGHATVVTFIFTRCPVPEFCPLVTSRFTELQRLLARDRSLPRDTQLLSITLDPAFDTPPILEAYARAKGADAARWRFATGRPDDVMRVARAFSVYVERNGALLDHTLATALVDADGRVVEIWRGNGWKAAEIATALRGHGES